MMDVRDYETRETKPGLDLPVRNDDVWLEFTLQILDAS